jgi:hypothetical protein
MRLLTLHRLGSCYRYLLPGTPSPSPGLIGFGMIVLLLLLFLVVFRIIAIVDGICQAGRLSPWLK